MNPRTKDTSVETEQHLLRTVRDLIEALAIERAVAVCHADPRLAGRVGSMIKEILKILVDKFMLGQIDLMTINIEGIQRELNEAVTMAAAKLTRTAPGSAQTPPSA